MPPTFSFLPLPGLREGDLSRDAMDGDVVRPEKGRCALTLATLRVVVLWLGFSLGTSSTQSTFLLLLHLASISFPKIRVVLFLQELAKTIFIFFHQHIIYFTKTAASSRTSQILALY